MFAGYVSYGKMYMRGLFKEKWAHRGIRKTAEEAVLSAARLVKAFRNLDRNLPSEAGPSGISSKSKAAKPRSRSPRRDPRPPLPRAPTPPPPPSPLRREAGEGRGELRREEDFDEEEESEEERGCHQDGYSGEEEPQSKVKEEVTAGGREPDLRRPAVPQGPPPRRAEPHRSEGHHRDRRGDHRSRDRDRRDRRDTDLKPKRKKKKKRRRGAKHQRHGRELEDPLRRSHRKLSADTLRLAGSFREGLERRA
eukprot:s1898_g8.t1